MVLTRTRRLRASILIAFLVATATPAIAQVCSSRNIVPDFGYTFLSCVGCMSRDIANGRDYPSFHGRPVVHGIRTAGPADGKLMEKDTLVAVEGYAITTSQAAARLADWTMPARLTVRRGSEEVTVSITPRAVCVEKPTPVSDARRINTSSRSRVDAPESRGWLGLGVRCDGCLLATLDDGRARWLFPDEPRVSDLDENGAAARAGLRESDVILAIDDVPVTSGDGGERLASIRAGQRISLTIRRGGEKHTISMTAESSPAPRGVGSRAPYQWQVGDAIVEAYGDDVDVERVMTDRQIRSLIVKSAGASVVVRIPPRK